MKVTVTKIGKSSGTSKTSGKAYQQVDLEYLNGDKPGKRSINQYAPVYKQVSALSVGDILEIEYDDTQYKNWTSVNVVGKADVTSLPKPATSGGGGNYETKEERQAKQVMIVRQSSLNVAVQALTATSKTVPTTAELIEFASVLEAYVLGKESTQAGFSADNNGEF